MSHKKIKQKIIEYIKFNIIGISNFLVSQIIYITLYLYFNFNYILAYSIVSFFSILASYLLNSKFTFKENSFSTKKFSFSVLIYIFEYILNMGVIIFLVNFFGISKIIAPLLAPVISTPPVFFLMRFIIKKK